MLAGRVESPRPNEGAARAILRECIEHAFDQMLAERLEGTDAVLRAELLPAVLMGSRCFGTSSAPGAATEAEGEALGGCADRLASMPLNG